MPTTADALTVFNAEQALPARMMAEMIALGLESRGGRVNMQLATDIRSFANHLTGFSTITMHKLMRKAGVTDTFIPRERV